MQLLLAACLAVAALPALAGGITVREPYALSSNPRVGAAYMVIENHGAADRLVGAATPVAERAELHAHAMEGDVMQMRVLEGIALPEGGTVLLERGGLHVMLIGLHEPLRAGESLPLTLVLESGAEIALEVPVKPLREPGSHQGHQPSH
ncbi:MAG TPA: copper chaperone PCu(A)C [Paracoccaceae bacterium]|nr:copper chaperone PCu(A)C [Paracoccaceae bacterium]